jgi:Ca-activated chloride channel family protein
LLNMTNKRKLQLRTISFLLTLTILLGAVCGPAFAEVSDAGQRQNGNLMERVYDSGNVTLSNEVKEVKNNTFTIRLKVKIKDFKKITAGADSDSSEPSLVGSVSSASNPQNMQKRSFLALAVKETEPEDMLYEVRYYIQPNFALTAVPQKAVYEEDSDCLSWSDLTAKDISRFSVDLKLKPVEDEKDSGDYAVADTEDKSGVYADGEAVYLFATNDLMVQQLSPITAKTAKLQDWDTRTYDLNLSVTAKSQIQTYTLPKDIILVLDRSASMSDNIQTKSYFPIKGKPSPTFEYPYYYIKVDGKYEKVLYDYNAVYGNNIWTYKKDENSKPIILNPSNNDKGELTYISAVKIIVSADNQYFIYVNGAYQPVNYLADSDSGISETGWYYQKGNKYVQVYPTQDGGNQKPSYDFKVKAYNYQFYTHSEGSITKLDALKEAANQFVSDVAKNSPDSRIGVVSFASNWWGAQEVTNNTEGLLPVDTSETTINNAIDSLSAFGGTHSYSGMRMARDIFDKDKVSTDGRKRVVIMFTDGEPGEQGFKNDNGYKAAAATINQSAILKAKLGERTSSNVPFAGIKDGNVSGMGCDAVVYTVGVFSELTENQLNLVNDYMRQTASPNKYYSVEGAAALNEVFQAISKEVGGVSGAKVTDVIDPRFELTEDSEKQLIDDGASIIENGDGTQTVTWNDQTIGVKKDNEGKLIPDWIKTFTVKARDQFIGGNNIPTNVLAGSGVSYGSSGFEKFPIPTVNVKPKFYVGNAESTIFYGEETPTVTLNQYKIPLKDMFCGKPETGTFSFQWLKPDGTAIASAEQFPANQFPNEDTAYTLKIKFIPYSAKDDATTNSDGNIAEATWNSVNPGISEGKYTVHLIKGELNITKVIDKQYPTLNSSKALQSSVFKIERRDTPDGSVIDTFYDVVTLNSMNNGAAKKISGLKKGCYTVTEQSGAWRYLLKDVQDNDDTLHADGTVFIGREVTADNQKTYFGTAENPAVVAFTNTLSNNQWVSAATAAVNTIQH